MNLVIDIGNSRMKFAIFDGKEIVAAFRTGNISSQNLQKKLSGYRINKGIASSVKKVPDVITQLRMHIPEFHLLSSQTRLPFKNLYETPGTLGPDRLAAAAGAFSNFPDTNVLIIDAGTAITYEFLQPGVYLGGNISPGLMMRFRALNRFTGKLPLVNPSGKYLFPGQTTSDAIAAGVISGMIYEINEYIRTFEKKHADTRIVLTGGDGDFFRDKLLKEVLYMPDLVMEGLNFILEYNAK